MAPLPDMLQASPRPLLQRALVSMRQWFDSDYFPEGAEAVRQKPDKFEWRRCVPFLFIHAGCAGLWWVGWSWPAVVVAAALYFVRMFAITGFYHRYFSHKTFRTSRVAQFLFAVWGNLAVQRGALWWAAVHRHHHQHSDDEHDHHSPRRHGLLWAHIGWMTSSRNFPTNYALIPDLAKYPELRFLNRFDLVVPACFAAVLYGLGALLARAGLETSGPQMLVWGFFVSTVVLLHGTLFINSLAHVIGRRRFETGDDSRNSLVLSLITLGEGWHNNHHRYQHAARNGFYWWEIDITWYLLRLLAALGIIWDLRAVPPSIYQEARGAQAGGS